MPLCGCVCRGRCARRTAQLRHEVLHEVLAQLLRAQWLLDYRYAPCSFELDLRQILPRHNDAWRLLVGVGTLSLGLAIALASASEGRQRGRRELDARRR
jgi:hypothetical protein